MEKIEIDSGATYDQSFLNFVTAVHALRTESSNGLYWGESAIISAHTQLRQIACELAAAISEDSAADFLSVFSADFNLGTPRAAFSLRVTCVDNQVLTRYWRLDYGQELRLMLADYCRMIEVAPGLTQPARVFSTARGGLLGPDITNWEFDVVSPLNAEGVGYRLPLERGFSEGGPGAAFDVTEAVEVPLSVEIPARLAPLFDQASAIATEALKASPLSPWGKERLHSIVDLTSNYVVANVDFPRPVKAAQWSNSGVGTGAEAAIFNNDGRLLLTKRADNGTWCIPGGATDRGELPAQTAIREALEETGVKIELTGPVCIFSDRHREDRFIRINCIATFLAYPVESDPVVSIQEYEVLQYKWIGKDEIDEFDYFASHESKVRWAFEAFDSFAVCK